MKLILFLAFFFTVNSFGFVVTSHKTAGLEFPENSRQGFIHSLSLSIDAIEIDLHSTKDRVLVLSHDPVFDDQNCFPKGSSQKMIIAQTHSSEILALNCFNQKVKQNYKIPTFKEILNAYIRSGRSDIELNIEIKVLDKLIENSPRYRSLDFNLFHLSHKEMANLVYSEIRYLNIKDNILFSTFSRELLLEMKDKMKHDESFRFGLLFKGVYAPIRLGLIAKIMGKSCYDNCWWANWKNAYKWMNKNNIDVFIPNWPQIDNFLFRSGFEKWFVDRNRNFEVYPWTLNTEEEWKKADEYHLDGVITDLPSSYLNR